jgi:hypothetical protein
MLSQSNLPKKHRNKWLVPFKVSSVRVVTGHGHLSRAKNGLIKKVNAVALRLTLASLLFSVVL